MKNIVVVFVCLWGCYVSTAQETPSITLYPNPAINEIHVLGLQNTSEAHILIHDSYGNPVQEHRWKIHSQSLTIPIPNLRNGIYMLTIETSNQIVRKKFRKQE